MAKKQKPDGWKSIPEAAAEAGLPERTLYNWQKSKRLETKTIDGAVLVNPEAVRALAAARAAGGASNLAGNPAGMGVGGSNGAREGDGEVAARVFEAFDAGESPSDLVRRLKMNPGTVALLFKQYEDLRGLGSKKNSMTDRLAALDKRIDLLTLELQANTADGGLPSTVAKLQADLAAIVEVLKGLPIPARGAFKCGCGSSGWVAAHVRCTACGKNSVWGFHPAGR